MSNRRAGELAGELGLEIRFHQSNAEHAIIDWIHEAREAASAIIINPAAYTHTSVAILDALKMCEFPVFEVHISNVHQRETFRHHSYVSLRADGVIAGLRDRGLHAGAASRRQPRRGGAEAEAGPMADTVSIAVVGAGLIGRRHADAIAANPTARLHSVVDPDDGGARLCGRLSAFRGSRTSRP